MAWCGYGILLILQLILAAYSLQSYIVVYVQPPPNSMINATCWSNNTNSPKSFSHNFTINGEFAWKVDMSSSNSIYESNWCRATMGNSILTKFPLFGDGLPRNSSEWLINSFGKQRLSLENVQTNDLKVLWNFY